MKLPKHSTWDTWADDAVGDLTKDFSKTRKHDPVGHFYPHLHKILTPLPRSLLASFSQKTLFIYERREFTPHCRLYHFSRNGHSSQPAVSRIPAQKLRSVIRELCWQSARPPSQRMFEEVVCTLWSAVLQFHIWVPPELPGECHPVWVTYEHSFAAWSDARCIFTSNSSSLSDLSTPNNVQTYLCHDLHWNHKT